MSLEDQEISHVGFHMGEALLRVAGHYHTLLEVLLESIQNSIDANANRIWVKIDQKKRTCSVRDNGEGVTRVEFEAALTSICESGKEASKLGRFGMGLISPLGKCEEFDFISQGSKADEGYTEWTFRTEELRRQKQTAGIPRRKRPDLRFSTALGRNQTKLEWRTAVLIKRFTTDRTIGQVTMDGLVSNILDKFSVPMRRNRVQLYTEIIHESGREESREFGASDFEGVKLPEVTIPDQDAGDTLFRLFLAKKTPKGRKGKVLVGEARDDFRLPFAAFSKAATEWIGEDIVSGLTSGVFEGEILSSRARLHPNRKAFIKDDALVGFCTALEIWFRDQGQAHIQEAKDARKEARYQELGLRSMKVLEAMLKRPEFSPFLKVVESFKLGNVGTGHAESKKESVKGEADPALSTMAGRRHKGQGKDEPRVRQTPPVENPTHHPFTVVGPKGKRRVMVRSNSLGLQFSHEIMEGSDKLWVLDIETGTLIFNIRHPKWVQCEEDDKALMKLQEFLAIQALVLYTNEPEWQEVQRLALDELVGPFVFTITQGDSLAGRRTIKVKTKEEPNLAMAKKALA